MIPKHFYRKLPSEHLKTSNSLKVSDKQHLGYIYDLFISALKDRNNGSISILELGVSLWDNGSGHAYCQMEDVRQYVGVDNNPLASPLGEKGVFIQSDSNSPGCIDRLRKYAPFQLLIHDAEHTPESQINFFQNYNTLCSENSIMICEDVYHSEYILSVLRDPEMHIFRTPPLDGQFSTSLVKIQFRESLKLF